MQSQAISARRALLAEKRDEILRTAEQYGASNMRIFGSVARGTDNDQSDIDLLVDLAKGQSLFDFGNMWLDLEDLLGQKIDVATLPMLKERIRPDVLKDAVSL